MPKAQNQSSQLEVVTFPMPNWVTMIEQNVPNHVLFKQVRKDIKEFTNKHGTEFDAIFLGCTHYPFLKKLIRQEMKACGAKSPEIYSQGKLFAHIISEKLDNLITAKAPDERRAGQESDQEIKLYSYYTGEISPKEIATKIRTGVDNEAMPGFAIKGIKVLSNDEIVKMMETAIYEQVPDLGTIHTRAGGIAARA